MDHCTECQELAEFLCGCTNQYFCPNHIGAHLLTNSLHNIKKLDQNHQMLLTLEENIKMLKEIKSKAKKNASGMIKTIKGVLTKVDQKIEDLLQNQFDILNGGIKVNVAEKEKRNENDSVWKEELEIEYWQRVVQENEKMFKAGDVENLIGNLNFVLAYDLNGIENGEKLEDCLKCENVENASLEQGFEYFVVLAQVLMNRGKVKSAEKCLFKALRISKKLQGMSLSNSEVLHTLGFLELHRGQTKKAEKLFFLSLEIQKKVFWEVISFGEENERLVNSLQVKNTKAHSACFYNNFGCLYFSQNKRKTAFQYFSAAFEFLYGGPREISVELALVLNNLVATYNDCDEIKIKELITIAKKVQKNQFGDRNKNIAVFWMNLGNIYMKMNSIIKAGKYFKRSLDTFNKIKNADEYKVIVFANIALFESQFDISTAENSLKNSLKLFKTQLNLSYAVNLSLLEIYGSVFYKLKNLKKTSKYYTQYLSLLDPNNYQVQTKVDILVHLGLMHLEALDFSSAEALFSSALEELSNIPKKEKTTYYVLMMLVTTFSKANKYEQAKKYLKKALFYCKDGSLSYANNSSSLAMTYAYLGKFEKSLELQKKANGIFKKEYKHNDVEYFCAQLKIADIYALKKDYKQAISEYEKVYYGIPRTQEYYYLLGKIALNIGNGHFLQGNQITSMFWHDSSIQCFNNTTYFHDVFYVHENIAQLYVKSGHCYEGKKLLERISQISIKYLGKNHPFSLHLENSCSALSSNFYFQIPIK